MKKGKETIRVHRPRPKLKKDRFYHGIEWLACWLLDHAEKEVITEEKLRHWAIQAWAHNEKKKPAKKKISLRYEDE